MHIGAEDYLPLKGFFVWMADRVLDLPAGLAPEDLPAAMIESFEARSMASARKCLAMGVGDILELTADWPVEQTRAFDSALAAQGLPSLSEVRARFDRTVKAILRRGHVRDESEYYTLRNAVELLLDARQAQAWRLLAEFEGRQCPGKKVDA